MRSSLIGSLLLGLAAAAAAAPDFDLQGHRGTRGNAPENTIAAFEKALAIGVSTLEMDAAITADGVVVVSHDPALTPAITRDASGQWLKGRGPLIRSLTLAQLQAYDVGRIDPASDYARQFPTQQAKDGERLPTLASVFARVKALGAEHVRFDIETKITPTAPEETLAPEPFVRALLAVIREAGMTKRVMIQSFDFRTLKLVQQLEPGMDTVYLTVRTRTADNLADPAWTAGLMLRDFPSPGHLVKAAGGTVWAPNQGSLTREDLKAAQQLGLKVIPWTVNDLAVADRFIEWGVDGIISDYPERIRPLMEKRGLALPPSIGPR
ncbi:MAG: glycerophosphodiester phosphodiesterase [Burkholderiales bacterium]|nr:glycerophosphodiester phosphodiesterase [Burkholderiales bacterium]